MRSVVSTALVVILSPAAAFGWAESALYDAEAERGGGGGLSFTGSETSRGLNCGHCHLGGDDRVSVGFRADPPLEPGSRAAHHRFDVSLEGEHAGLERSCDGVSTSCNVNTFALEVTDGQGRSAGRLCPEAPEDGVCPPSASSTVTLTSRETVARPTRPDHDVRQWSVFWIPPQSTDVEVNVWIAVLDGNGGDGSVADAPVDMVGDDVALRRERAGVEQGCSVAPGAPGGVAGGLLLLALLAIATRRRGRLALLVLAVSAACAPEASSTVVTPDETVFGQQVLPLLRQTCLGPACHEGPRPAGSLDLSSFEGIEHRADAILPYGPYVDGLLLLKTLTLDEQGGTRIRHAGVALPRRSDERFRLLQSWVQSGAPPLRSRSVPRAAAHLDPGPPPVLPGVVDPGDIVSFAQDLEPYVVARCAGNLCHSGVGGTLWIRSEGDEQSQTAQNVLEIARFITAGEDPAHSPVLRKLVPSWRGGLPHVGGVFFDDLDEARQSEIGGWVEEHVGEPPPETRTEEEQFFAASVQPALVRQGCLFLNCHGPGHFSDLRFEAGVAYPRDGEIEHSFSRLETHLNYESVRAQLALGPYPGQSRVARKATAVEAGGLDHLAFASFVEADDPDRALIEDWAGLETAAQESARGLPAGSIGRVDGLVWVESPPYAYSARSPGQTAFGARLMFAAGPLDSGTGELDLGAPEELGADVRQGRSVRIGTPAVSYDGTRVVFGMQVSGEEDALLYEIDLDTRETTQLTEPGDCPTLDLDPTYGWDDSIVFVSTRACQQTPPGPVATHLFRLAPGGTPEQITFSPFQVYAPWVHLEGKVHFSQWRGRGEQTPIFRVLLDGFEPRDHLGNRVEPERLQIGVRSMPDGREVLIQVAPEAAVPLGDLAAFSRSFGPPQDDPYRPTGLTEVGLRGVHSVAPLPDGQLVVARTGSRVDVSIDPPESFDVGLQLYRFDESNENLVRGIGAIVDEPGVWEISPAVVQVRPLPTTVPETRVSEDTELIFHSVVVADSLFRDNTRERLPLDPRVAGIRLLEAQPNPLGAPIIPEPVHRRAAEAAVESDGSVRLRVPGDVPIRYQSIDRDGLALENARWHQAVRPGTSINQNTPVAFFDSFCGGCHGGRGMQVSLPVTIDVLSGASLSVAAAGPPREAVADDEPLGFVEDVWEVLQSRCAGCHAGTDPAGDLSLEGDADAVYDTLVEARDEEGWRYVDAEAGLARRSCLVEPLLGRELDCVQPLVAHPPTELTEDELGRITLWIDLGASRSCSCR